MTRKYSPCCIKSNSDKRLLFAVENQKKHNVAKVLPCLSFLQVKMFVANILGNNFDKPLGNVIASRTAAGVRVICKVWPCNYSRQCQYLYLYLHLCSMAARIF